MLSLQGLPPRRLMAPYNSTFLEGSPITAHDRPITANRTGTAVCPEMVRVVTWIPNRYAAVWSPEAPQDTT